MLRTPNDRLLNMTLPMNLLRTRLINELAMCRQSLEYNIDCSDEEFSELPVTLEVAMTGIPGPVLRMGRVEDNLEHAMQIIITPEYPYEIKLQDEFFKVMVKGPKLLLDKLNTEEDVALYIDVTSLKPPGPYKQPIRCVLPKNIELVDKLPEVRLDIRENLRLPETK